MPSQAWYVESDGEPAGPFTAAQLRDLATQRLLSRTSRVRLGDSGTWIPASKVRGLFSQPEAASHVSEPEPAAPAQVVESVVGRAGRLVVRGVKLGAMGLGGLVALVFLLALLPGKHEPRPDSPSAGNGLVEIPPAPAEQPVAESGGEPPDAGLTGETAGATEVAADEAETQETAGDEPVAAADSTDEPADIDKVLADFEQLNRMLRASNEELEQQQETDAEARRAQLQAQQADGARRLAAALILGSLFGGSSDDDGDVDPEEARRREQDERLRAKIDKENDARYFDRINNHPFDP